MVHEIGECSLIHMTRRYLVHVPLARGKVMPEMDSINEDFPAL